MAAEQAPAVERRVYPMGLHRGVKEQILGMVPDEMKAEARGLLRTGEESAVIFARVSRTAASFDEIAKGIDEEGAARFHSQWTVSTAGYGHKSVGEHAVIQIAVENVSSFDGDEITDNRLGSYTEFSARFKGRQNVGWDTPAAINEDPALKARWDAVHGHVFAANDALTQRARQWILTPEAVEAHSQLQMTAAEQRREKPEAAWKARLGKHAADQFKDMLPASRYTNMGVTMNATEMESMLRKLLSSPMPSTREVGMMMKDAAMQVAPTLLKYADFNPYIASLPARREDVIKQGGLSRDMEWLLYADNEYEYSKDTLVHPKDVESAILSGFAFESSNTSSFQNLLGRVDRLSPETKAAMFDTMLGEHNGIKGVGPHDLPPRAMELDGGTVVEIPGMTYGMWREFKRHRMMTYMAKPLDVTWGYKIPPMAELMDQSEDSQYHGSVSLLKESLDEIGQLFAEVQKVDPVAAQLAVTRLHYRPAIAQFDAREAFHLLKVRTGNTAHPFMRELMWPIYDALNAEHPSIYKHMHLRGQRTPIAFP